MKERDCEGKGKEYIDEVAGIDFDDEHEANMFADSLNELIAEKCKIRHKEITVPGTYCYVAILYLKQDEEFKALVKEYKENNKGNEKE